MLLQSEGRQRYPGNKGRLSNHEHIPFIESGRNVPKGRISLPAGNWTFLVQPAAIHVIDRTIPAHINVREAFSDEYSRNFNIYFSLELTKVLDKLRPAFRHLQMWSLSYFSPDTNVAIERVTLESCSGGSALKSRPGDRSDWSFCGFPRAVQVNVGLMTWILAKTASVLTLSASLQIVLPYGILTASLNEMFRDVGPREAQ